MQAMTGADPDRQDDQTADSPPGIVTAVVGTLDDPRVRAFIAHLGIALATLAATTASLIEFGIAVALYTLAGCAVGISLLYGLES